MEYATHVKFSIQSSNPHTDCSLVSEECFGQMLHVEQKRTERSGKCFMLMLLEFDGAVIATKKASAIDKVLFALSHSTRETDVKGWYRNQSILGVIFTEITPHSRELNGRNSCGEGP